MPRRNRCLRLGGRLRVHHGGPRGTRLLASRFSFKNARVFAPEVWCRASEQPALLALDFLADLGLPGSVCTAIPSSLQRCHLLSELSLADHKTFQSGVTVHPEVVRLEPCARDVRFEEARGVTAPTSSNAVSGQCPDRRQSVQSAAETRGSLMRSLVVSGATKANHSTPA
jgi:hypothetical protein